MKKGLGLAGALLVMLVACKTKQAAQGGGTDQIITAAGSVTIDKKATKETRALFNNLKRLSAEHSLFGHQHATEYGHGWSGGADRSDVKSVTGSHPAVIGVDFSGFTGNTPE